MSNFHKKLVRAGWRQGKAYKKQSNRDLRNQEHKETSYIDEPEDGIDSEILQQVTSKKLKPNTRDKDIFRMISVVRRANKLSKNNPESLNKTEGLGDWTRNYYQSIYQEYKKAKPKLIELLEDPAVSNKIKRQIRDVL